MFPGKTKGNEMRCKRHLAGLVLTMSVLAVAAVFTVVPARGVVQDRTSLLIGQMIAQIRSVSSPQERAAYARSLTTVLRYLSDEGKLRAVDDSLIDDLAALLRDDIEAEDFSVAGALGFLGPRAAGAVPTLEAVYPKACAKRRSYLVSSGIHYVDAIELALERITGRAPSCR